MFLSHKVNISHSLPPSLLMTAYSSISSGQNFSHSELCSFSHNCHLTHPKILSTLPSEYSQSSHDFSANPLNSLPLFLVNCPRLENLHKAFCLFCSLQNKSLPGTRIMPDICGHSITMYYMCKLLNERMTLF